MSGEGDKVQVRRTECAVIVLPDGDRVFITPGTVTTGVSPPGIVAIDLGALLASAQKPRAG